MAATVVTPEAVPLKNVLDQEMDADCETRPLKGRSRRQAILGVIDDNKIIVATLVCIAIGFGVGLGVRELRPSSDVITWLGLPGEIFLRCIKMTIVPLLSCLIINTTASFDPRSNGRIASIGIAGFVFTQLIATTIALLLFFVFRPDVGDSIEGGSFKTSPLRTSDVFADLIRNIFPDNIVGATIKQAITQYTEPEVTNGRNSSNNGTEILAELKKSVVTRDGVNILGLVFICSTIGVAAHLTTPAQGSFRTFFKEMQHVMMRVTGWMMWLTPVGVASLIAASVATVEDIAFVFETLALLIAAVSLGLFIHLFLVLPGLLFLFIRRNPYACLFHCARPGMVGFAATATSVALPDMLLSAKKCGAHSQVMNFVIPMSVSLHADGSSLYMASSALFIGQITGSLTSVGSYVIIGVLSTVLGLAIPPVPSASIACLVLILTSANIPIKDIGMLFMTEWLLDRLRSGVNAVSHVFVAIATSAICHKDLEAVNAKDVLEFEPDPDRPNSNQSM